MNTERTVYLIIICILVVLTLYFSYNSPQSELYRECINKLGDDNFTVVDFRLNDDQHIREGVEYYYYRDDSYLNGVACKPKTMRSVVANN